jgi:hypothetical protein
MCSKPLKYSCRSLEEGTTKMILPSIFTPTLGGPRNQDSKHHHKLNRYRIFCFSCKKRGHKDSNCWNSKRPRNPCRNYFQYCRLTRHWEAKCWRLHPELHPKNKQPRINLKDSRSRGKRSWFHLNPKEKWLSNDVLH